MSSTDIKDYYRRAWGLKDRPGFKYGGSWADWQTNYSDQMTFEEYLQDDNLVKKPHFLDRKAEGGRIGFKKKGFVESKFSKNTPSVYDNLTEDMKNYYEEITGTKWNKKDWDEGNYRRINKSRKAKDVIKKPQVMDPYYKKVGFFKQFEINQRMLADEAKLAKKGFISARKLNELLGRPNIESSIDDLKRVIDGDRVSPWLNEKEGVAKWKKSKNFSFIDRKIGGQKFYKMPNETTLNSMKNYYKNQEFLSDFKYGKIKNPSIKGAKLFYDDETLMKALKAWSGNTKEIDQNALKVLNSVFGADNWAGPNAIKNLGRALSGEIKIEGIKVNKALGKKILDGMSRTANSVYGGSAWDQAAYKYAKNKMDTLFKNKGSKTFTQLYDETEKILIDVLGKKRGQVAIDEVLSLRTGLTNDSQVYSVFSQVIDKKVNENFKKSYDANLSKNFKKIREEIAKGAEADLDKIKGWTDQQNIKLAEAKKKYPNIKFANFGKFDVETGKFAKPQDVFGKSTFTELPSDIQKRIRKDYRTSGVSVDVGGAQTQKQLMVELQKLKKTNKWNKFLNSLPVKIAKGGVKAGARTVGAAMPVIGPGMVAWGLTDVNKAYAAGLTDPDDLAVAYNFGPELAESWSTYKKQEMKPTLAGEAGLPEIDSFAAKDGGLSGVDQYLINRYK